MLFWLHSNIPLCLVRSLLYSTLSQVRVLIYLFIYLFILTVYFNFQYYYFLLRFYLFIFREVGKGGRKREWNIRVWLPLAHPTLPSGLQPRHVPWLGIKPAMLWFAGLLSIHWATPARASSEGSFLLPYLYTFWIMSDLGTYFCLFYLFLKLKM